MFSCNKENMRQASALPATGCVISNQKVNKLLQKMIKAWDGTYPNLTSENSTYTNALNPEQNKKAFFRTMSDNFWLWLKIFNQFRYQHRN